MISFPYRYTAIHMGDHLIGIVKPVIFGGFNGVVPLMCQHAPYNSNGKRTHNVDTLFYDVGWIHPGIPEQGTGWCFLCWKCAGRYEEEGNVTEAFMHRKIGEPDEWEAVQVFPQTR